MGAMPARDHQFRLRQFRPHLHARWQSRSCFASNKHECDSRHFELYRINLDGTGLEQVTQFRGIYLVPGVLPGWQDAGLLLRPRCQRATTNSISSRRNGTGALFRGENLANNDVNETEFLPSVTIRHMPQRLELYYDQKAAFCNDDSVCRCVRRICGRRIRQMDLSTTWSGMATRIVTITLKADGAKLTGSVPGGMGRGGGGGGTLLLPPKSPTEKWMATRSTLK